MIKKKSLLNIFRKKISLLSIYNSRYWAFLIFLSCNLSNKQSITNNFIEKGTIIICSLQEDAIYIASDSRIYSPGKIGNKIKDSVEKVIKIKDDLIFAVAGVERINDRYGNLRIKLAFIAKQAITSDSLIVIANKFIEIFDKEKLKIPIEELNEIIKMAKNTGQDGLFDAIFAGKDKDGKLKIVTVICDFTDNKLNYRIELDIAGPKAELTFLGSTYALKEAFNNPESSIGQNRNFKKWHSSTYKEGKKFDMADVVEGLVDFGIRYIPPQHSIDVGYPIYVYKIDKQNGFEKLKESSQKNAVILPY